ncbi:hypothetical protein NESM_000674000 [Novymonas esmeraldas]|uniref:Transcription factor Iwr1 domain-containing protein n=1 Tax=Novymonas esmeraldas TaxID=1808958 RepID=A0AAW0ESQ7_9TRYP
MVLTPSVAAASPSRVYLKISRKRARDDVDGEGERPTHVRVEWDSAEMGVPPPALHAALASRSKFLFRRLRHAADEAAAVEDAAGNAPLQRQAAPARPPSRSLVERVTVAGQCLVIECGVAAAAGSADRDGGAAVELFVLDARATESAAMVDAFGDFAVTEAEAEDVPRGGHKRNRDTEAAGELPCYFLAPLRRTSCEEDHSSAAAGAAVTPSPSSCWGVVRADEDGSVGQLLREYDEALYMEGDGEAAADLYCYPDHRKDDEYDSNAEDFSGNDYPNDADDRSAESTGVADAVSSDSSTGRRRRGAALRRNTYGIFCEDGYSERSLSSGWGSDDD